jgi:NAD(P)-dependent dehydrogenase (short-subunit alcohol dehydrogenase family)
MKNKTVLITGATNGIGKAAALEIAKMGATVVLVGRDKTKTQQVLNELQQASGNNNLESMIADLSSQKDIRKLASDFKAKHSGLDVLINNAGGFYNKRQTTLDGLEYTLALNHLSYFLLTHLLLDLLKAIAPSRIISSRIINVSSDAHQNAKLDFSDLQSEKSYSGFGVYGMSKLANVLFTYQLAKQLENTDVTVNALHPGFVNTGFANNSGGFVGILLKVAKRFALKPDQGADTLVYLATSPEVEGLTGKYFVKRKETRSSPLSYDQTVQKKLWDESAKLVNLT